jgi:tricorn protease-like protein
MNKFWRCSVSCDKNETLVSRGPDAFTSGEIRGVVVQESEDGKYWYYTRQTDGDANLRLFREKMIDGHLEQDEQVTKIPKLDGYHSFYVTKDGIYFVPGGNAQTLWYFDFATQSAKQPLRTERNISFGFSISSDGRYALLPQWGDYHQDIMLAEATR